MQTLVIFFSVSSLRLPTPVLYFCVLFYKISWNHTYLHKSHAYEGVDTLITLVHLIFLFPRDELSTSSSPAQCFDDRWGPPMEQEEAPLGPIPMSSTGSCCFCLTCLCLHMKDFIWETFLLVPKLCPDTERMHSLVWMDCVFWYFWPCLLIRVQDELEKKENDLCLLLVSYIDKELKDL